MVRKIQVLDGFRWCPGCRDELPVSEFSTNPACRSKIKLASHCRKCSRILSKQYYDPEKAKAAYAASRDRHRDSKLRRAFGITLEQYMSMLERQGSACAICGMSQDENGKALAVDHSHATGSVRDLLCSRCNAAVGFVRESAEVARKIADYIERWSNGLHVN